MPVSGRRSLGLSHRVQLAQAASLKGLWDWDGVVGNDLCAIHSTKCHFAILLKVASLSGSRSETRPQRLGID